MNCDEQYLPGALAAVGGFFERHPQIDVLFGDVVMVDTEGRYLYHRKMQTPLKYHTWTCHLSTLSCAMFFRRRIVSDYGLLFDPRLRDVGDGEWMVRLLQRRVGMAALGQFTSVFTCTGANMSTGPNARREKGELFRSAPFWARGSSRCSSCNTGCGGWRGGCIARSRLPTRSSRWPAPTADSATRSVVPLFGLRAKALASRPAGPAEAGPSVQESRPIKNISRFTFS